jgi:hypothetical protein
VRRVSVVVTMVCAMLALSVVPAYAKTVPVKTWVSGICTNLVDWQNDLEQQSDTFQSTVTDSSSIADVKAMFVDFLDGAIASTKTMIANVKALGTPKIADGKGIAGVITTGVTEVQAGFKEALASAKTLPTKQAAFKAQLDKITKKLDASSNRASKIFDSAKKKYDTKSVDAARKGNTDCATLS